MNKPDFVETANRADEVLLKKLRSLKASDNNFPYWLRSAALSLCVNFNDDELKGKLKHVDELVKAVKMGFEQIKHLLYDLSEEEGERMVYCQARFNQIFEGKPVESKTFEVPSDPAVKESEEEVVQESMTDKKAKVMVGGNDELICAICGESLKRPHTLPCSHVFCMHCLEETGIMTNKNSGYMMPCRVCGQEFKIPKEGFDNLENFEAVEKVTEPAQLLAQSSTCNTCEACAEDSDLDEIPPAVTYCVDCERKLCAQCRRCHKRNKLLKMHRMQDLEDSLNVSGASGQLTIERKTGNNKECVDLKHKLEQTLNENDRLAKLLEEQRRIDYRVQMSHADTIQKNHDVLQRCTTVNLYVIDYLRAEDVLDDVQESDLKAERSLVKQRILLFKWLTEVSPDRYESFLQVMKDTEQEHVANLLTGSTEEDHLPLSDVRYTCLAKIRHKLANCMHTNDEVIARLISLKAISMIDAEEIKEEKGIYSQSSKLISAVMRRSNHSYNSFQEVLRKTNQTHVAEILSDGEVIAAHVNSCSRPDLDEFLSKSKTDEAELLIQDLLGF